MDTSVFGGTRDDEFAEASGLFFDRVRSGEVIALISQVALDELRFAPAAVRSVLDELPGETVERVIIDDCVAALAAAYLRAKVVGATAQDDALHVAAATVAQADLIVSWNFRHIVNFERIRMFNDVNRAHRHAMIDIRSPLEIVYGGQEQDI